MKRTQRGDKRAANENDIDMSISYISQHFIDIFEAFSFFFIRILFYKLNLTISKFCVEQTDCEFDDDKIG